MKNPEKWGAGLGLPMVERTKDLQTLHIPHKQESRGFGHNTCYFFPRKEDYLYCTHTYMFIPEVHVVIYKP